MDVFLEPLVRGQKADALFEQLRDAIVSGQLTEGDRLPTTRSLARQLGVSRNTVTTVYGRLVAEGYVEGRAGAGSYVSYRGVTARAATMRPSALAAANRGLADAAGWSLGGFDNVEPTYDLRTGRPDPALFPLVEWRRSMSGAFHVPPEGYRNAAGQPTLRRAIAQWVGRSRGVDVDPDHVLVTAGAQQAVDVVTRLLVEPDQIVAVEDPGYPPVVSLFHSLRAKVVPVPVDGEGIVVDRIPSGARIVYVTPSHQSPTGVVMSMRRRHALLDHASRHDLAVVEDDYDSEYRHADRPLEPLYRLDRAGRVVYIGTFSKILSPSLRLGFLVLPPSLAADAVVLRSLMDWQPPAASQYALHRFIVDGHLERHLRRTRRHYTDRHALVRSALDAAMKDGLVAEVVPSLAGLHVTAHLAAGITEAAVRAAAGRRGVALGNYGQCWQAADGPEGIVVGFGAIATEDLPQALEALMAALHQAAM